MAASQFTPWNRVGDGETLPAEDVRSVCVIGAGASGLVAAKYLKEAGYKVTIVEQAQAIGGVFDSRTYDDARLVSSTYLTAFSDLRMGPDDKPHPKPHVSAVEYVEYLREYCRRFELERLMRLGTRVLRVERRSDGGYHVEVATQAGEQDGVVQSDASRRDERTKGVQSYPYRPEGSATCPDGANGTASDTAHKGSVAETSILEFDAVCICCGVHEVPYVPHIDGAETFTGHALHSSSYKDKSVFRDKRALVLGCGESGMDIAYRAVQEASEAAISIRNGLLAVPHDGWGGLPLDTLICNLCEHSYEHWWCHAKHLKWRLTTYVIRVMFLLSTGTSIGYSQWTGRVKDVARGHHILCKSTAALPYINRPFKQKSWRRFVWWWAEKKVDKSITSFPAPAKIQGDTVTFVDGRQMQVDVLVYATGYRQCFPFLKKGRSEHKLPTGHPRGPEDALPSDHLIVDPAEPRLAFIGFVRPNVGAIPPMSELQVMWWIERLRGHIPRARAPPSYGLLGRKLVYGVDYGNYMHQVAAEFGAAPSLSTLSSNPRALLAYCLGQAYITFFRLTGPFATKHSWHVASTELFTPVVQRGFVANAIFIATMAAFGAVSLVALVVESVATFVLKLAALGKLQKVA